MWNSSSCFLLSCSFSCSSCFLLLSPDSNQPSFFLSSFSNTNQNRPPPPWIHIFSNPKISFLKHPNPKNQKILLLRSDLENPRSSSFSSVFFFSRTEAWFTFLVFLYRNQIWETPVPHELFIHIICEFESLILEFYHWTWASEAQDTSLLISFENVLTNEYVSQIILYSKFPRCFSHKDEVVALQSC